MAFVDVLALEEVESGATHGVEVAGIYLTIVRVKDSIFALDGYCTHERQELGGAPLDGFTLYCPRHFSSFDVRSGKVLGPPAEHSLRRYDTKVIGGRVYVDISGDGDVDAEPVSALSGDPTRRPAPLETPAVCTPPALQQQGLKDSSWVDGTLVRGWTRFLFGVVKPVYVFLHKRGLSDWLNGTKPFGHPLHPAVTDLPFGLWGAGIILYVAGYPGAAAIVTASGAVAALMAIVTGFADWVVSEGRERRLGAIHGGANFIAIGSEIASVAVFYSTGGVALALALCAVGLTLSMASAYIGGHLVFDAGAMVNHTAFTEGPRVWTGIGHPDDIADGDTKAYELNGRRIIVWRDGSEWSAIEGACSHGGARLDQGVIARGAITCPLHGSIFSLRSGAVLRGPAIRPQPCLDVRVNGDALEVRVQGGTGR